MPKDNVSANLVVPVAPIGGNIEDGLPGTPKKIGGSAVFLVSAVASTLLIAYVSVSIGLAVLGGGLLVSAVLGVWGMVENYGENKKKHELQMENLAKQNDYLNARTNQVNMQTGQTPTTPMNNTPNTPTPNIQNGQNNFPNNGGINSSQPRTTLNQNNISCEANVVRTNA